MINAVRWIEIPTTDMDRAVKFYSKVLGQPVRKTEVMGAPYAFLPDDGGGIRSALAQGAEHIPCGIGVTIYLSAGDDLDQMLARIETAGGLVLTPKTPAGEMGHIALFVDSEGNRIGLRSAQ